MKTKFKLCAAILASALAFSGVTYAFTLIELMIVVLVAGLLTPGTNDPKAPLYDGTPQAPKLVGIPSDVPRNLMWNPSHNAFRLVLMNHEDATEKISTNPDVYRWKKLAGFVATEHVESISGPLYPAGVTTNSTYTFYLAPPPASDHVGPQVVGNDAIPDHFGLSPGSRIYFTIKACGFDIVNNQLQLSCSDEVTTNSEPIGTPTTTK